MSSKARSRLGNSRSGKEGKDGGQGNDVYSPPLDEAHTQDEVRALIRSFDEAKVLFFNIT
jgi:hypothetical protein